MWLRVPEEQAEVRLCPAAWGCVFLGRKTKSCPRSSAGLWQCCCLVPALPEHMAQFPSIAPKSNSDLAPIVGLAPTAPAVCWLSWWWPYVPVAWLACPSSMGAGAAVGAGWDLGLSPGGGPGLDGQHQSASDSHDKNKNHNKQKAGKKKPNTTQTTISVVPSLCPDFCPEGSP